MSAQKDGSYLVKIQAAASPDKTSLPTGNRLMNDLIVNNHVVKINMFKIPGERPGEKQLGPGAYNSARGYEEIGEYNPNEYNGIGADQSVFLGKEQFSLVEKSDGATGMELMPYEVMVAHELIHALHGFTGTKMPHEAQTPRYTYQDRDGVYRVDRAQREELKTVGLSGYAPKEGPTENKIREEQKVAKNVKYP